MIYLLVIACVGYVAAQNCPDRAVGHPDPLEAEMFPPVTDPEVYAEYLNNLDIEALYDVLVDVIETSQDCWPADGPQDGDIASYAGFFIRAAWHCSGTLRIHDTGLYGGCEGGRLRFWPEREWRDNGNLDQALSILAGVKVMQEYQQLSWGDLITFAATVAIANSGGPASEFCFGRLDSEDGSESEIFGIEGIQDCVGDDCANASHTCDNAWHWPDQDPTDHPYCGVRQAGGRIQGSHSVGLIYVFPEGPQLRSDLPDFDADQVHQRSISLSAWEVRDTFSHRMDWTPQETVALIGGGHTLGRAHGDDYVLTSGFEGPWTNTPSQWNYEYFSGNENADWYPSQSPVGNDQWATDTQGYDNTFRLTADLALNVDPEYKMWSDHYLANPTEFDRDFAQVWHKLVHRSTRNPDENDLKNTVGVCHLFDASLLPSDESNVNPASTTAPVSGLALLLALLWVW